MKKNALIFVGIAAVILSGIIFCYTMFFSSSGDTYYYARIDNSKFEQVPQSGVIDLSGNGGMDYSYTLSAYDENGGEKDITFGVSRELRESAFLRLTFRANRGVMDWCEVQYDELPPAVQKHYTAPPQSVTAGVFSIQKEPWAGNPRLFFAYCALPSHIPMSGLGVGAGAGPRGRQARAQRTPGQRPGVLNLLFS